MKTIVFIVSLFIVNIVLADVYKYTNEQGKTSFSDAPVSGAKKIVVPPVMTYTPPPVVEKEIEETSTLDGTDVRVPYEQLIITAPQNQGTVRNNEGKLTVAYKIVPGLQAGDKVELFVDGARREGISVEGLVRGQHTVRIQAVNDAGDVQISSPAVTFHLHHQSAPRKTPRI